MPSYSGFVLQWIRPIVDSPYSGFALQWIRPIVDLSYSGFVLYWICLTLDLSHIGFVLQWIRPTVDSSYSGFILQWIRPTLDSSYSGFVAYRPPEADYKPHFFEDIRKMPDESLPQIYVTNPDGLVVQRLKFKGKFREPGAPSPKLDYKCLMLKLAALLTCIGVIVATVVLLFIYVPRLVKGLLEKLCEFCSFDEVCSRSCDGSHCKSEKVAM